MGQPMRAKVLGADANGVKVEAGGVPIDIAWTDIAPERLFGLAKRLAEKHPAAEQVALVGFAKANGMDVQAGEEATRLAELDPALKDKLFPPEAKPAGKEAQPEGTPTETVSADNPILQPPAATIAPASGNIGKYQPVSAAMIPKDHPRLFFRRQAYKEVPSMAQALANAKTGLRGNFSGNLSDNNAAMQALKYLLTNDTNAAKRAIELMKKRGKGGWYDAGEWTSQSALAYDWLYDYPGFTKEDKAAAEEAILYGFKECWDTAGIADNHFVWNGNWICLAGAVCASVALYGHRDEITPLTDKVLSVCEESLLALDYMDGAWLEGPTYAFHTLHDMVIAIEGWWSATGENPYTRHPGLARFVQWFAWMTRPDWSLERWDDASGGSTCFTDQQFVCYMLAVARGSMDPVVAWYAKFLRDKWGNGGFYPEGQAHYAALFDFPEKSDAIARPPARLSEIFGKGVTGFIAARSGWGPGDSMLTFRCGQIICPGHQHYCANSFTFFHKAPLAIDSGQYNGNPLADYMHNYTQTSVAHNVVIFPNPQKPEEDGGQDMAFRHVLTKAVELITPTKWSVGTILSYEDKGSYVYIAADATRAYTAGCKLFIRELVYIRPNVIVILDRTAPSGQRRATWLLHSFNEPQINGPNFVAENEGMRLAGTFILPTDVKIDKVGGPGKEFWNKGKNWPPGVTPGPFHEPGAWRVEAYSNTPGQGWFLVVIESNIKSASAPQVTPLMDDPNTLGVSVNGRAVLFQKSGPGGVLVK
jgi:hypothetical protein